MKDRMRRLLPVCAAGIGAGLLCRLLAVLTVRHLGEILTFLIGIAMPDADVGEVFRRLFVDSMERWNIVTRLLFPFLICFAAAWIVFAAFRQRTEEGNGRTRAVLCRVAAVFAAVLLFIAAYLVTLWLNEVNGVRFGDVIRSLIGLIRSGALDSLSSGPAAVLPEVL